ncbi:MAG: hypothetical protein P8Z30_12825 [Acidobacteriota bacterium]
MVSSDSGSIPKRVIVIQLVIVAGLVAFFKLYLPHMEKARAAAELAQRERRIEHFFNSMVEDSSGGAQAQTLRSTPSMQDVEQALGAPDTSTTDFRGGLHLTWIGVRHNLEAGFDRGRLYSLVLTNRRTGQSVTASSSAFQSF